MPEHVPPRTILVGADFGPASNRALAIAGGLGERFGAAVTAVHAESLEVPPYFTLEQIASLERERERTWDAARTHLQAVADAQSTWPIAARVVDGPAVPGILSASAGADLLVLGTHGRRGPGRWWLGSVAEGVLRATAIPLLVVRADAPLLAAHAGRVMVLAGEALSAEVRAWAQALAAPAEPVYVRDAGACAPAALAGATVVLVPLGTSPTEARVASDAVHLLRECGHPLLFIPLVT
jgi:nucleotide-binding universal stress UspA family protein